METKKKLRKDIDKLYDLFADIATKQAQTDEVVFTHQCRIDAIEKANDVITGRECAHMLGYKSDSIKSDMLKKKGIEFTLDEKGRQKISRESVMAYLAKMEDQSE